MNQTAKAYRSPYGLEDCANWAADTYCEYQEKLEEVTDEVNSLTFLTISSTDHLGLSPYILFFCDIYLYLHIFLINISYVPDKQWRTQ